MKKVYLGEVDMIIECYRSGTVLYSDKWKDPIDYDTISLSQIIRLFDKQLLYYLSN